MSLLQDNTSGTRCADCLLPIYGADARQGPDDKPYHPGCHERLFPAAQKHQDGQGNLTFAHEEQRE